jgi:uncharacterized membrane protein
LNKTRFEAFSDGVYSIAITLLILAIALPGFPHAPSDPELAFSLIGLWPKLVAYVLSFAVIGIMWQNHHALFRLVRIVDRKTVFLNLALLAVTVFIPFATSVLGAYPGMRSAEFLYGLTLTGSATAYNLLLGHLVNAHCFEAHVGAATIRETVVAYRVGWVTYTVATLTSLVVPYLSFALYVLIAGYYLVPRGADRD